MRRNNEQATHVQILLTALNDSENKQQDLVIELKNLKEQVSTLYLYVPDYFFHLRSSWIWNESISLTVVHKNQFA